MFPSPERCSTTPSASRRGVALITVLAMVVIVSFLLVAFVTAMRQERTASQSYSQAVASEHIARGAMALVLAELQNEMGKDAPPNLDYPAKPVFTNVVSTNIMPQRVGTNAAMPNLVKISTTTPAFAGGLASGRLLASSVSTTTPANNGRFVDTNRWNLPRLGGFPDNASTPNWILLTRSGATNTGTFGATGSTLNNPDVDNPNFAIGRFAYAIYDVGGLLDVTVAGYPSSLSAAQIQNIKGSLAGALVDQANFDVAQDGLIAWRNAASRTDYVSYVTNFLAANAAGTVFPGDNAFLSRQDLIKAARDGVAGLSTNALPNLTTFSRDRNAPSWGPTFNAADLGGTNAAAYAYKNNVGISTTAPFSAANPNPNRLTPLARFASPATLTDYRLDGSPYTYDVIPGDAVVQRWFPLGRLAWIGPGGPQNGGTAAAIQSAFGLVWGPSQDPELGGASVWRYVGHSGGTSQQLIKTLDQVAAEGRSPNFFELLQAGILRGSLGVSGGGSWYSTHQTFPVLQILRIGAALIDQYDSDSFPSVIEYTQSGYPWLAAGVESLPHVNAIAAVIGVPQSAPQTEGQTSANAAVYLTFNLWNPHRSPAANAPPVRLRVRGSVAVYNMYGNSVALPMTLGASNEPGFLADVDSAVELSPSGRQGFSSSTAVSTADVVSVGSTATLPSPDDTGVWVTTHSVGADQKSDLVGLRLRDFPFALGTTSDVTTLPYESAKISLGYDIASPFNAFMEFQSPSGAWIPYQFATGINDPVTWFKQKTGNYNIVSVGYAKNNPRPTDVPNRFANFISYLGNQYPATWTYNATAGTLYRFVANGPLDAPPGTGIVYLGEANTWDRSLLFCSGDPRSIRFNMWLFDRSGLAMTSAAGNATLWSSSNNAAPYEKGFGGDSTKVQGKPTIFGSNYFPAQLARNNFGSNAALSETGNSVTRTGAGVETSYADNDGLRRTADSGLFVDPTGVTGNPFERLENRPVVLNRPFQSVGEMGFAFRDSPWRSLDLFSSKSADAGLLDFFTIQETTSPTVSGRINLNTRNQTVLTALMSDTASDPITGVALGNPAAIAASLTQFTATNQVVNKSDLANLISPFLSPTTGSATSANFTSNDEQNIKYRREAFVRALADVTQTRTWNLMIDLLAQSGRFPPGATTPDKFVVEGERRYWLHVAVDRFTGEILEQKWETVTE